jgi:hypothetical protein
VLRAAVPETSIHEHRDSGPREDNIYLGFRPIGRAQHEVFAEAQTALVERRA